ncbi:AraC family transcriptional regulator [Granulicella sp. dw_53]|uniref:AraC family transcriptional regulator n=1 Tax=Granulicella sp. dw_53 TaxID=2719792 RepID=UPI001BD38F9F|nr:AraC family transcriptional regulator [Granulicella sp. dw_53]
MKQRTQSAKLSELATYLHRYTEADAAANLMTTPIEGLSIRRSNPMKQPMQCLIKPALCMTVQGSKVATFGTKRYDFSTGEALVVTIDMPTRGTAFAASSTQPYLGLVFELDLKMLQTVADDIQLEQAAGKKGTACVAFVLEMNDQFVDCALRAVQLLEVQPLDRPNAIKALYPAIMRELCYWLLNSPRGAQALLLDRGRDRNLMQTIHLLRDRFRESLRIEDLARAANMSPTTFFRQFKAVTSMAPLQYQKQLRLLEARRMMIFGDANVETAAFDVGYASPSQFSREYSRAFGSSPRRDVSTFRTAQT